MSLHLNEERSMEQGFRKERISDTSERRNSSYVTFLLIERNSDESFVP